MNTKLQAENVTSYECDTIVRQVPKDLVNCINDMIDYYLKSKNYPELVIDSDLMQCKVYDITEPAGKWCC